MELRKELICFLWSLDGDDLRNLADGNITEDMVVDEYLKDVRFERILILGNVWGGTGGKYCPYCGEKKSFLISTDINSGRVCKNKLCQGK